jgi:hypothetical protein
MNRIIKNALAALLLFTACLAQAQILNESFDGVVFPPAGWGNVRVSGTVTPGTWDGVTSGTNPTCSPHSGSGMAYYNAYSWSGGTAADLSTPVLDFSSGTFAVSFWMYRDVGWSDRYDSVAVYVNTTTTSAGGTRLGVINRAKNLPPVVSTADGWYQYTFNIPGAYNTATNHLIFKGTSGFGNRIFVDDITVYSLNAPANPTAVSANDSSICNGSPVKLYAAGIEGTVYWYSGSCGGALVGTGDSIFVVPAQTTTYYARNYNGRFSPGCAQLTVTVGSAVSATVNQTICANTTYTLPDGSLADSTGTYIVTIPSANGCDSTITTNLTELPALTGNISTAICSGSIYDFNGQQITQQGTYYDTLTSAGGCDSVVRLNLSLLAPVTTTLNEAICAGGNYNFNGQAITAAGIYYDTLTAANGCDSIITLNLAVNNQLSSTYTQSICYGDSVLFGAAYYLQSGAYSDTLTSVGGCDSIVTLQLTVGGPIASSYTQSLCYGDSILFKDGYLTQSGTYTDTLASAAGCDSVVTLVLSVASQITSTVGQSICHGDSVLFNGNYYSIAGNFSDTLTSVAGCDSIVTLALTYYITDSAIITQNGFSLSVNTFNSYQWYLNGAPIQGATSQSYTATANGLYSVAGVDANGCNSESVQVVVAGVGIVPAADVAIRIYPNPVSEMLQFYNLPAGQIINAEVYNVAGQRVLQQQLSGNSLFIQVLAPGFYTLQITGTTFNGRYTFIKE